MSLKKAALWVGCDSNVQFFLVQTLLHDVNVKTTIGSTTFDVATGKGYADVERLLKEHMARIPAVDERCVPDELDVMDCVMELSNCSPFTDIMKGGLVLRHMAGSIGHPESLVRTNERTNDRTSPLEVATYSRRT